MKTLTIPEKILRILCCCSCKEVFRMENGKLICNKCGRAYSMHNGIPVLKTAKTMRIPKIYDDPDYLKFNENLAYIRERFCDPGIISWGQNAGHRAVRKLMNAKQYNTILDLGCGEGGHYPFLDSPHNLLGVDIDLKSLERLKRRFPDFWVINADIYDLPIINESVDCVMNIYNLEHMAYLDIALEEMHRILSPGGSAFISVPNEGGLAFEIGRKLTTAKKFSTSDFNYERAAKIEHMNSIWQVEKALKRYFKIKKKIRFPFNLPGAHFNLVTSYHCMKND